MKLLVYYVNVDEVKDKNVQDFLKEYAKTYIDGRLPDGCLYQVLPIKDAITHMQMFCMS